MGRRQAIRGQMMDPVVYDPIGIVHSPFKEPEGTPIQASAAEGAEGTVEIFDEFSAGLKDIDGFSHIILLFHFHLSRKRGLHQIPFMDKQARGVFSIRSPSRPNPIGMSIVSLDKVEGNILYVSGIDIVDGTPLLDIKPYVPEFDCRDAGRIGWLQERVQRMKKTRDDGRFAE